MLKAIKYIHFMKKMFSIFEHVNEKNVVGLRNKEGPRSKNLKEQMEIGLVYLG